MDHESPVHRNILDNMREGVMSVDPDGRIMTFNPSACRLLSVPQDDALGHTFAEVLLAREGLDDFNEALLDAVRDGEVGQQREVEVRIEGSERHLSLTTSYLRGNSNGLASHLGVIAVFADVTEVTALRESQRRLTRQLEAQNAELQHAYRDLEENNQTLAATLKQVQTARVAATVFIIGLFLAIGFATWNVGSSASATRGMAPVLALDEPRTLVVAPQRLVSTIALFGQLVPHHEVHVASPADGKVAETHFQYGERVAAGQRLVTLDTTEVERQLREAHTAHIRAVRQFEKVENWENSTEIARLRRELSKGKLALESSRSKAEQSAFLLEQGIVSAVEHEAAEQQYHSQTLDYESLQQDYANLLTKGDAEAREVAQLELDNARVRVEQLEEVLRGSLIEAPIGGVVLQPQGSAGSQTKILGKGQTVSQGERLISVGDVEGLSALAWVDEVDVAKVRVGQRVKVHGDAFPGLELGGGIVHVSRQAGQGMGGRPTFEIVAAIDPLSDAARQQLRLGMSARLEVVAYDKPDALLVPIAAVDVRRGEAWLRIKDRDSGAVRSVQVEAGLTTLDSVEIMHGLAAGDEVVVGAEEP